MSGRSLAWLGHWLPKPATRVQIPVTAPIIPRHKTQIHKPRIYFGDKEPMPLYILLSNLTDEGWKTIRSRPERIKEVNKELEAFGVKVLKQYATLGAYDFVNIVEAPDNKTVAKVSIELGSRGTIQISTMPAFPIDEFISSITK